jgi:heme-degrading monooxygenase HmoA
MTAIGFAELPDPPYYAVIFSSQRTPEDAGYAQMADRMVELAAEQPGYLGIESARDAVGFGITVSYWNSLEAIKNWRVHSEHKIAQEYGIKQWYRHYQIRIARVERAYGKHPLS